MIETIVATLIAWFLGWRMWASVGVAAALAVLGAPLDVALVAILVTRAAIWYYDE